MPTLSSGAALRTKLSTLARLVIAADVRGIVRRVESNWTRRFSTSSFERFAATQPLRARNELQNRVARLPSRPTVSVLTPVYNVTAELLSACLDSVRAQVYPYWEHCLADDASTVPHVRQMLETAARADARVSVVFRESRGGIAAATQSALQMANGEYVALLDDDDELSADALAEMVLAMLPGAAWGYSDFALKRADGTLTSPFFKPDFSPERLMSQMYLAHLQVMRRSLVAEVGGFRQGFDGSQDFDLALRMMEVTSPIHVPKVLYHWRMSSNSTAGSYAAKPYADSAAKRALRSALVRRGLAIAGPGADGDACDVEVESTAAPGTFKVQYKLGRGGIVGDAPMVSILMPLRDVSRFPDRSLSSIAARTRYQKYEVILIDSRPDQEASRNRMDAVAAEGGKIRCYRDHRRFNQSALNNAAAARARGEVLLLLSDDVEIDTPDWLEQMLMHAQKEGVGAVSALLLHPDRTIQHAGIITGLPGVARPAWAGKDEYHLGYFGSIPSVINVSAVTCACLMVRRAVYEQVGGFDEAELPTDYNDVDFCLRLLQCGYRNVYTGHARLIRHESARRANARLEKRARRVMERRWGQMITKDCYFPPNLSPE